MNNKKYGYSFDISEDQIMEEFIAFVIDKPEIHYDAVLNAVYSDGRLYGDLFCALESNLHLGTSRRVHCL